MGRKINNLASVNGLLKPSSNQDYLNIPIGSLINDRFQILKQIHGERVYLVSDLDTKDALFALKISRRESIFKEEFNLRREYIIHSMFNHDNIVRIGEPVETQKIFGFLMEFVGGGDVGDRLHQNGLFTMAKTLTVFRNITNALAEIHAKSFIHGDIKPENILISSRFVKLTDFGIARDLKFRPSNDEETRGTLRYLCPIYLTSGKLEFSSDIYSLALVVFEMLTGTIPFANEDIMKTLQKRVYENPPSLKQFNSSAPSELCSIIARCLSINKRDRYDNILELKSDLDKIILKDGRRKTTSNKIKLFRSIPQRRRNQTILNKIPSENAA